MSTLKKVSVIIPVYDIPDYMLEECVHSLLAQTLKEIEFIFVNDASNNPHNAIFLSEIQKTDERVEFIDLLENGGVSHARNIALRRAKGEYVGFVDADDTIEDTMYENLYKEATKNKADIVICNSRCYVSDKDEYVESANQVFNLTISTEKDLLFLFTHAGLGSWDKIFRRELCYTVLFPVSISNFEDYLFNWTLFLKCHKIVSVSDIYYNARYRENSASRAKMSEEKYRKRLHAIRTMFSFAEEAYEKFGFKKISLYLNYYILYVGLLDHALLTYSLDMNNEKKLIRFNEELRGSLLWMKRYSVSHLIYPSVKKYYSKNVSSSSVNIQYSLIKYLCLLEIEYLSKKESRLFVAFDLLKQKVLRLSSKY